MVETITPYLVKPEFVPYGVTAAMLTGLTTEAATFNALIGKANEMGSHAIVGNEEINDWIKKLRGNYMQFDLLLGEYEKSHPEFVQGYHINSAVGKLGMRHSGIEGMVKNGEGAGIAGAVIKLRGTHYETVSDLYGNYRLEKVMAKDYIVDVTANGYTPATMIHHISRGKMDDIDFVMTLVP